MCGIVGLYLKNPALEPRLGEMFAPMLVAMSGRGPDSAGFAIYRRPADDSTIKVTLQSTAIDRDWSAVQESLGAVGDDILVTPNANAAVVEIKAGEQEIRDVLEKEHPDLRIMSIGHSIEILKEAGLPVDIVAQYGLVGMSGSHIIGHTRMATESDVTTEGSHPFSTGMDLCLVHNGSFSNHNRLREVLRRKGIQFETDNDTEVAAGYLTWRLQEGDALEEALEHALRDLDGFYTLAIGTKNGFAVLRDPIACKPAVMAETDDYVAIASEYQSLAHLPGIESARLWEPEPARVYVWGEQVAA